MRQHESYREGLGKSKGSNHWIGDHRRLKPTEGQNGATSGAALGGLYGAGRTLRGDVRGVCPSGRPLRLSRVSQ